MKKSFTKSYTEADIEDNYFEEYVEELVNSTPRIFESKSEKLDNISEHYFPMINKFTKNIIIHP